jgi:hypothetical protein
LDLLLGGTTEEDETFLTFLRLAINLQDDSKMAVGLTIRGDFLTGREPISEVFRMSAFRMTSEE